MEAMDIQAVESKLSDVTVTAIPMSGKAVHKDVSHSSGGHATISTVAAASPSPAKDKDNSMSKYAQLLAVIEEMGKEVRPSYSGSRSSAERLKRAMMEAKLHTKFRWNTGYSADSVEWCPVPFYTDYFVCGTYQLHKDGKDNQPANQKRLGRIYLFRLTEETTELTPIQTIEIAGVLDQKWCCHLVGGCALLAVVTSEGFLQVYKLIGDDGVRLELWIEKSIGENLLALSVDWSSNRQDGDHKLVVSDSGGGVTVLQLQELELLGSWQAHGFEAWVAAFDYWRPQVFYTGGDDCAFKSYDLRVPEVVSSSNKTHGAGVTAVRSHVLDENQLLTGSYDEIVRQWDPRQLRRCVTEANVDGGVWRLKWHPEFKSTILAACMYGGFRILNLETEFSVISEYLEHESIAYGADWNITGDKVGTCSFYDCKLHVSDVVFEC